jgi:hypothetical protein
MITDTHTLEEELRTLYAWVAPPARKVSFESFPAVRADRRSHHFRLDHRRFVARGLAVGAIAAVAVAGAVIVHIRSPTPASPARLASLTVFVLPSGGQLNCTIAVSALSDVTATGFITFVHSHASFHPVTTTGNTYVPGLRRWVETTPQMVAPDGNSYVTGSGDQNEIDVVNRTGTHTVVRDRGFISVLGYSPAGIVLLDTTPGLTGPPPSMPIWLLDPQTGAVRALPLPKYPQVSYGAGTSSMTGYQAGTNSVWLQAYDSASNLSVVSRYDLTNGVTTTWFDGSVDGHGAAQPVAETAASEPIIQVASSDIQHIAPKARAGIIERTLLMASPHHAQILNQGQVGDPGVADNLSPLSATDGTDVWLAGDNGTLWRYQPGEGLQPVAAIRTSTNGAPGVSISGPCV